jgi:hypothetical protein
MLLVPRSLAQYAVEAEPNKQSNQREDDDNGQALRSYSKRNTNIVPDT